MVSEPEQTRHWQVFEQYLTWTAGYRKYWNILEPSLYTKWGALDPLVKKLMQVADQL